MPYLPRTNQLTNISVDVQKDLLQQDGTEPWTITSDAPFTGEFSESGVGDAPPDTVLAGPFYEGRDYTCTFHDIANYTTPGPVSLTASAVPQEFTGNYQSQGSTTRDLDANGWSLFFPESDSRQIHVSNDGIDDVLRDGSESEPYATIAFARNYLRTGYSDWLLLRRGDVWNEGLGSAVNGRSRLEPTIYTSYGASSVRPLLRTGNAQFIGSTGTDHVNICVVGLEGYANFRDEYNNPGEYAGGPGPRGFQWVLSSGEECNGILFEDVKLSYYVYGGSIQGPTGIGNQNVSDVKFRRCVIHHSWSHVSNPHSQGLFMRGAEVEVYQCILDHNGWKIQGVGDGSVGTNGQATYFNHNTYFANNCSDSKILECVSMRSSANHNKWTADAGQGSVANLVEDNNLKIDGEVGIDIGGNDENTPYRYLNPTVTNNVITELCYSNPTGRGSCYGIWLEDWDGGLCDGNLLVHKPHTEGNTQLLFRHHGTASRNATISNNIIHGQNATNPAFWLEDAGNCTGMNITGNILQCTLTTARVYSFEGSTAGFTFDTDEVYSLRSESTWHFGDGSSKNTATWNADTGDTADAVQTAFVDDTRSIETYMTHIGEAPATIEQFYALQRQQSKANWRTELTAPVINDWFRAGFTKV